MWHFIVGYSLPSWVFYSFPISCSWSNREFCNLLLWAVIYKIMWGACIVWFLHSYDVYMNYMCTFRCIVWNKMILMLCPTCCTHQWYNWELLKCICSIWFLFFFFTYNAISSVVNVYCAHHSILLLIFMLNPKIIFHNNFIVCIANWVSFFTQLWKLVCLRLFNWKFNINVQSSIFWYIYVSYIFWLYMRLCVMDFIPIFFQF